MSAKQNPPAGGDGDHDGDDRDAGVGNGDARRAMTCDIEKTRQCLKDAIKSLRNGELLLAENWIECVLHDLPPEPIPMRRFDLEECKKHIKEFGGYITGTRAGFPATIFMIAGAEYSMEAPILGVICMPGGAYEERCWRLDGSNRFEAADDVGDFYVSAPISLTPKARAPKK
jgi:hypothetical protein